MSTAEVLYAAHVPPGWPENLEDARWLVTADAFWRRLSSGEQAFMRLCFGLRHFGRLHADLAALDADLRAEVGAAIAAIAGVES